MKRKYIMLAYKITRSDGDINENGYPLAHQWLR